MLYRPEEREGGPKLLTLPPMEFLRRWGLLMPPPNKNLVRYYGALAPHSPLRNKVVAEAAAAAAKARRREKLEKVMEEVDKRARSWAACLARVFEVFPLICPKCKKTLVPIAIIFNDAELVRLLTYFNLPADFPRFLPVPKEVERKYAAPGTGPPRCIGGAAAAPPKNPFDLLPRRFFVVIAFSKRLRQKSRDG